MVPLPTQEERRDIRREQRECSGGQNPPRAADVEVDQRNRAVGSDFGEQQARDQEA